MAYFSGEYECKIDAKGRIVLPAKLKAKLPEVNTTELIIKRGFEPCLVIYPQLEWMKVFNKVSGLSEFNQEYRTFQRSFLRGATEVDMDSNGRILLPKTMTKFAEIEEEVIVVGAGNRIEIWNPTKYDAYLIKDENEFSALAQKFLAGDEH
jgi:MraZ protein